VVLSVVSVSVEPSVVVVPVVVVPVVGSPVVGSLVVVVVAVVSVSPPPVVPVDEDPSLVTSPVGAVAVKPELLSLSPEDPAQAVTIPKGRAREVATRRLFTLRMPRTLARATHGHVCGCRGKLSPRASPTVVARPGRSRALRAAAPGDRRVGPKGHVDIARRTGDGALRIVQCRVVRRGRIRHISRCGALRQR
jgi:hypothetical protein